MSEIHEFITVDVPFDPAPVGANDSLSSQPADEGAAIAPLHVQVGDLAAEREGRSSIVPVRRYSELDRAYDPPGASSAEVTVS